MNKDTYKVQNMYSGKRSGKTIFAAQKMAIDYIEKGLGKTIEIIHCDHEEIINLKRELEEEKQRREDAEKIINLLHEKEESTTLKSECWIMAVNYKDKYNESGVVK